MPSSSLRILHVLPSLAARTGGPATSVVNLAQGMGKLGHQVTIYATDLATAPQAEKRRGHVRPDELASGSDEVDVELFPVSRPSRMAYAPSLGQTLAKTASDFDLIHIHSLFIYPQFAAWRAASRLRIPYVVSVRGALDPYLQMTGRLRKKVVGLLWQDRMLNQASALHCTSVAEQNIVAGFGFNAPITVLPNCIAQKNFGDSTIVSERRARLLQSGKGPLLINHGRISKKKGLEHIIRALPVIQREHQEAKLAFFGPDDEGMGDQLRAIAHTLGVDESVSFNGSLPRSQILEYIAASDFWILPSYGENFGNAVIEAMATGTTVLTTPLVDTATQAANNEALVLIEPEAASIASEVLSLLSDPNRKQHVSENGRKWALQFSPEVVAPEYIEFYENILEHNPRRQT